MTNLNAIATCLNLPLDIVEDLAVEYSDLYETIDGFIENLQELIAECKPCNEWSARDIFIIEYRQNKKHF